MPKKSTIARFRLVEAVEVVMEDPTDRRTALREMPQAPLVCNKQEAVDWLVKNGRTDGEYELLPAVERFTIGWAPKISSQQQEENLG